jgi:hypothetical protein
VILADDPLRSSAWSISVLVNYGWVIAPPPHPSSRQIRADDSPCAANLNGGFSTGKIIAIAAGGGAGILILIALAVVCTLKCINRKVARRAKAERPRKVMTPQYAQPYWEQDQKQVRPHIWLLDPAKP